MISNHSIMQMQVFLIILLVALGAAKRERNHDERFALRELLKGWTSLLEFDDNHYLVDIF